MKETFRGFLSPSFTQVPDEFFDALLPSLSESELKVLLYIIRHTIGLKKQKASISIKQFQKGFPGTGQGMRDGSQSSQARGQFFGKTANHLHRKNRGRIRHENSQLIFNKCCLLNEEFVEGKTTCSLLLNEPPLIVLPFPRLPRGTQ